MQRPWGIRLEDESPLTLTAVLRGQVWCRPDGGEPVALGAGDLVVSTGAGHWTMAGGPEGPDVEPGIVIHPGQLCTTPDGRSLTQGLDGGVRTWGNGAVDTCEDLMVTGAYWVEGEVGRRLLQTLPRLPDLLVLRRDEIDSPLLDLLDAEVGRDRPGQEAVLDRLLDLLLITSVRTWFERAGQVRPPWWSGRTDVVLGPALQLLQDHPEHPWTVAELAARTGLSRAAFARRFSAVLGEPPMAFLTRWRILTAADLLLDRDLTLATVATRVGYATPFALSAAFKRELGASPREYRARAAG